MAMEFDGGLEGLSLNQSRKANAAAVIRLLVRQGPLCRREMAESLGLTQSALTRIVNRLLELKIVEERTQDIVAAGRGRPQVPVAMRPEASTIMGFAIGVEHIICSIAGADGSLLRMETVRYDRTSEGAVEAILEEYAQLSTELEEPVDGIGIVTDAWVDPQSGVIVNHPVNQWHNVALAEPIRAALGRDDLVIVVESVSRGLARSDVTFGISGQTYDFLHVFGGNRLQVVSVMGGRLIATRDGFGGDLAPFPIPGLGGKTVDDLLTDTGLFAGAQEELGLNEAKNLYDVINVAREGTPRAQEAQNFMHTRAYYLGRILGALCGVLRPDHVVVSSHMIPMQNFAPDVHRGMKEVFTASDRVPDVLPGDSGPHALARASTAVALEVLLLGWQSV